MPHYIQLDENDYVTAAVTADAPPVHANQYQVDDTAILIGKVLSGGAFYPPKIVADTAQSGISVTLGNKITG